MVTSVNKRIDPNTMNTPWSNNVSFPYLDTHIPLPYDGIFKIDQLENIVFFTRLCHDKLSKQNAIAANLC